MVEQQSTRRNFLKYLGLSAGASVAGTSALAAWTDSPEIRKLNPEQREFMGRYGKWMDEFLEVSRIQKSNPDNLENQKKLMDVAEKAKAFQPELAENMKDKTFALTFKVSIERISKEI